MSEESKFAAELKKVNARLGRMEREQREQRQRATSAGEFAARARQRIRDGLAEGQLAEDDGDREGGE